MSPKKKLKKKAPKPETFVIKVAVDSKTLDFYKRLGKLCRISAEKACLVVVMAESLRITDAQDELVTIKNDGSEYCK